MELTYRFGAAEQLWAGGVLPVYLFYGDEDRLKEEAIDALRMRLVDPDFAEFDYERLTADSADGAAILSAAGQIAFGSERRLIVVKGLEQWRERGKQTEADRLAEGIGRLPSTCCLVLVVGADEEAAKRKTALTTKVDNAVKKVGGLVLCSTLKGEALVDYVATRIRLEGKRIAPDGLETLIQTVGGEMRLLEMEISKLVSYVGDRDTITARDVGLVVASSPEDVMFSAIDAICKRQPDRALTLLAELHRYDPKAQAVAGRLLALLSRQFRMLWQAKFLAENRVSPRDVRALPPEYAAELPSESNIAQLAFKAADLFTLSKSYTWAALTSAMEKLLLCDLANKGGVTEEAGTFGSDPVGNLQLLVLELTGAPASGRR